MECNINLMPSNKYCSSHWLFLGAVNVLEVVNQLQEWAADEGSLSSTVACWVGRNIPPIQQVDMSGVVLSGFPILALSVDLVHNINLKDLFLTFFFVFYSGNHKCSWSYCFLCFGGKNYVSRKVISNLLHTGKKSNRHGTKTRYMSGNLFEIIDSVSFWIGVHCNLQKPSYLGTSLCMVQSSMQCSSMW